MLATETKTIDAGPQMPLPGARVALILLLTINLFNYIDRQVLAAVETDIEETYFPPSEYPRNQAGEPIDETVEAQVGSLNTAFMVSYMLFAPLFGWLGDRPSPWMLVGLGRVLWTFPRRP